MGERLKAELPALPAGWKVVPLRALCRARARYGSPEPAHEYDAELPRYVRITDITDEGRLRSDARASLPHARAAPFRLVSGDLLVARSGATAGKSYLYDGRDGDCAHAGYLICFPLNPARCEPRYVASFVRSTHYRAWVKRTVRQAAQPNINAVELGGLGVPLPPLAEQRRIAALLQASEELIQASAQIVDKLEAMKRALLHELLARGVDEDGVLRSGPRRDTAIGPVAEGWRVEPVASLLAPIPAAMRSGPFGSELKKSDLVEDGVPLLGIDNVDVDVFVPRYRRFVSWAKVSRFDRFLVRPGDVMITVMGTVGRACVVPATVGKALSSKHVWTLTFDSTRYVPELAALQFNHARWVREHFRRDEQGGTMSSIRADTLRSTLLPVPPLAEQRRIAGILGAHEQRVALERATLAKHRLARQALIDALTVGWLRC